MKIKLSCFICLALSYVLPVSSYVDTGDNKSNFIVVCDKDNECEYGFVTTYEESSEEDAPFVCYPTDEYTLLSKYDDLEDFESHIGDYFYFDTFIKYIKNYDYVYTHGSEDLSHYAEILKEYISEDSDLSGDALISESIEIFLDCITEEIEKLNAVIAKANESERSLQMKRELLLIYYSKQSEAQEMGMKYWNVISSVYN